MRVLEFSLRRSGLAVGVAVALSLASTAEAGPRLVLIAAGDCKDSDFLVSTAEFEKILEERLNGELYSSEAVVSRFKSRPTLSLEEIERLLETAQTQYYSNQFQKAAENIRQVLSEVDKVSVTASPWRLKSRALVLAGLIFKNPRVRAEPSEQSGVEYWRQLLRVQPQYELDLLMHSNSTRAQFAQVRKELTRAPRHKLSVQARASGVDVFLDGAWVGKTPFIGTFPKGRYSLTLGQTETSSFVHRVELEKDTAVSVDLDFEARLRSQAPVCMSTSSGAGLDHALKLAATLGSEEVIVLRRDSREHEPMWLNALRYDLRNGQRVREGGLGVRGLSRQGALAELADFVVFGKVGRSVQPVTAAPPVVNFLVKEAMVRPIAGVAAASPGSTPYRRYAGYVALGTAVAAGAGAGIAWLSGGSDRERLASLIDEHGRVPPAGTPEHDESIALRSQVQGRNGLVAGLAAGAGATAVLGGLLLYFSPANSPAVGVELAGTVGQEGGRVFVRGRF